MAFPVVETTAISGSSPNQSPHSVTLPAGIVAGDLLFVLHSSVEVGTFPAGWTVFQTVIEPLGPHTVTFAYRLADGLEGGSISVSQPSSTSWAAQAFRISGTEDPAVAPPEALGVSGTIAPLNPNANPPALSPASGSQQYLWFAVYSSSSSSSQGAPPNTPGFGNSLISGNASQDTESVRSNTEAATVDPEPAWTSPDNSHTATTVAIPPAGIAGSAVITGTIFGVNEGGIRAGGKTLIITLTNSAFDPTIGLDNSKTQDLIDGLDSDGIEANGWDAIVKTGLTFNDVTRDSDTVVTILLPAFPTYDITLDETITVTVPVSAQV